MKVPDETDEWRTSSFSATQTDCVEARCDLAALRDSKNPTGPIIEVAFHGLVSAVKADRLTR